MPRYTLRDAGDDLAAVLLACAVLYAINWLEPATAAAVLVAVAVGSRARREDRASRPQSRP
jgi:hypothetical protein